MKAVSKKRSTCLKELEDLAYEPNCHVRNTRITIVRISFSKSFRSAILATPFNQEMKGPGHARRFQAYYECNAQPSSIEPLGCYSVLVKRPSPWEHWTWPGSQFWGVSPELGKRLRTLLEQVQTSRVSQSSPILWSTHSSIPCCNSKNDH